MDQLAASTPHPRLASCPHADGTTLWLIPHRGEPRALGTWRVVEGISPSWSPSGAHSLLHVSTPTGGFDVELDASAATTRPTGRAVHAPDGTIAWSPDGHFYVVSCGDRLLAQRAGSDLENSLPDARFAAWAPRRGGM